MEKKDIENQFLVNICKCIKISNIFKKRDYYRTFVYVKSDKTIILDDNIVVWD